MHVYSVLASAGDDADFTPRFSYSIGLLDSSGVPDVIVLGENANVGKSMIDAYRVFTLAGRRFEPGTLYPASRLTGD
ncbi:MAG: DUF4262 domain-containing protein [Burkholderiaceae bacterium]